MTTFDYGPIEFYAIALRGRPPRSGGAPGDRRPRRLGHGQRARPRLRTSVAGGRARDPRALRHDRRRRRPALDLAGLAGQDDILFLAENLQPGSSAAILVIELLWAKAFASALYDAGGAVIAREGIPAPIVNAFLSENAD